MLGLMQQRPLLISTLVDYAASWHGGREIVSRDADGAIHRSNYAEVAMRAKRLANALDALGPRPGRSRRDARLEHLSPPRALLWRRPARGGCCTRSTRACSPISCSYIIHHAEDAYVFFDPVFAPLIEQLAPRLPLVRGWVVAVRPRRRVLRLRSLQAPLLRGSARRRRLAGLRMAGPRRERRLDPLLHLRHHRQSEGRAVQPPLDGAARLRRLRGRRPRAVGARFVPRGGAALSRQRLERAVLRARCAG